MKSWGGLFYNLEWDLSWHLFLCFFAVPQHFVCPLEFCHGESGEHPPIQSVAPADSNLGKPVCLSTPCTQCAATISFMPIPPRVQGSMTEKGKPFWDFKSFMDCLFHIESCFVVQNFLMFISIIFCLLKRKKINNKLLCIAVTSCYPPVSSNPKSFGIPKILAHLHLIY